MSPENFLAQPLSNWIFPIFFSYILQLNCSCLCSCVKKKAKVTYVLKIKFSLKIYFSLYCSGSFMIQVKFRWKTLQIILLDSKTVLFHYSSSIILHLEEKIWNDISSFNETILRPCQSCQKHWWKTCWKTDSLLYVSQL